MDSAALSHFAIRSLFSSPERYISGREVGSRLSYFHSAQRATQVAMSTPQQTDAGPTGARSTDASGEDRRRGKTFCLDVDVATDRYPDLQDFDEDGDTSSIQPGHESSHALSLVGVLFNDPTDPSSTSGTEDDRTSPQLSSAPDSEGELVV